MDWYYIQIPGNWERNKYRTWHNGHYALGYEVIKEEHYKN